ncbi:MAG: methyltransferase regulatory domain-containing protein [Alphaproteobacteria bacterium]|nr:methyltransferase regulatory domain-containing protein [Alphaproteobacteria bacterium]
MSSALSFDLSPVRLSYAASLRGIVPLAADADFTYAHAGRFDVEALLCLAASNPQGQFYGLVNQPDIASKSAELARLRNVNNITFLTSTTTLPRDLDYLCCEITDKLMTAEQRSSMMTLAETHLAPSGLFCCRYLAYASADDTLRFLLSEYRADLGTAQTATFLADIKNLGTLYFADHPQARQALDRAIATSDANVLFTATGTSTKAHSETFELMKELLPRNFAFAGDAEIARNYLEMVAPTAAQTVLVKTRDQLLYEPIKDFALQKLIRNDIWVRLPANQSLNMPDLCNPFTFGILTARAQVPQSVTTHNGTIPINTPLFTRLIDMMTDMPIGVGDFLTTALGVGMNPSDVVSAMRFLVAANIAQPMRGRFTGTIALNPTNPQWASAFNDYLTHAPINNTQVRVASSIVGESILLGARDALVLQAISRAGLAQSSGILRPELQRLLSANPSLTAQITDSRTITDDVISNILTSTLNNNATKWYTYGILAA